MGRVRATTVAVEKPQVLRIVSACVDYGIQHAVRMRRIIVTCGPPGCTTFFHIIS